MGNFFIITVEFIIDFMFIYKTIHCQLKFQWL